MATFATDEEKKAFEFGIAITKRYIAHCIVKSLSPNLVEMLSKSIQIVMNVTDFVMDETPMLPNEENLTFSQFCDKYEC